MTAGSCDIRCPEIKPDKIRQLSKILEFFIDFALHSLGSDKRSMPTSPFAPQLMPHYTTEPHRRMAFFGHVPAFLARTRSGNLKLSEDSHGLQFELSIPDTRPSRDVLALAERGDLGGMSFAFIVPKDGEREFLASRQFAVEELARLLKPAGRCAGNADTERLGPWLWGCFSPPAY
jgi:hypothetical protein